MAAASGSAGACVVSGEGSALKAGRSGGCAYSYWCILDVSDTLSASRNPSGTGDPPVGAANWPSSVFTMQHAQR